MMQHIYGYLVIYSDGLEAHSLAAFSKKNQRKLTLGAYVLSIISVSILYLIVFFHSVRKPTLSSSWETNNVSSRWHQWWVNTEWMLWTLNRQAAQNVGMIPRYEEKKRKTLPPSLSIQALVTVWGTSMFKINRSCGSFPVKLYSGNVSDDVISGSKVQKNSHHQQPANIYYLQCKWSKFSYPV